MLKILYVNKIVQIDNYKSSPKLINICTYFAIKPYIFLFFIFIKLIITVSVLKTKIFQKWFNLFINYFKTKSMHQSKKPLNNPKYLAIDSNGIKIFDNEEL